MPLTGYNETGYTKQVLLIALITVGCLMPFVTKAFHIDDPLFLWIGRQIQTNPFDFFGFTANWYGRTMPMYAITQNPPLTSYFIALVAAMAGWSEVALHVAFWLPAVGVGVGTMVLARHFCHQGFVAALVAVLTPAFLVSATNVMADIWLLCFFVWALVCWLQALAHNRTILWIAASALMSFALLTKYFGVALIPLLLVYTLCVRRRTGWWLIALLIPLVVMVGYQLMAMHLYGRGLFTGAAAYAVNKGLSGQGITTRMLKTLAFSGGTLISTFLFLPLLHTRRYFAMMVISIALVSGALFLGATRGYPLLATGNPLSPGQLVQLAIGVIAGLHIAWLTVDDLIQHKDTKALLLFLWVSGVFVFTALVNWSVNARTVLPMAPAVGILVARRLETRAANIPRRKLEATSCGCLCLAAIIALMVVWADYTLADSQRAMAHRIHAAFPGQASTISFQGHWGFQYYMQELGYRSLELSARTLKAKDIVVTPLNNTNVRLLPRGAAHIVQTMQHKTCRWLTTMQMQRGAGFYADQWGPLPFVFGKVPVETYLFYRIGNAEKGED